jgi:hypothetical protein
MKRRSEARMKERRSTSSAEDGRAREERRREGNEVEPQTRLLSQERERGGRDTEHMEGGREEGEDTMLRRMGEGLGRGQGKSSPWGRKCYC